MDFLDSLDLQVSTNARKTDRMRSWYLYEQYKTLEQHQLDAARTLRNRSFQERLLQRELTERRARRSLYDQVHFTRSEPQAECSQGTCLSTTADDFYESFCELHDFEANSLDRSCHGSDIFLDDCKTTEFQEDTSCANSVASSIANADKEPANVTSVQRSIAENIKLHLQTVKENMVSLEKYARMADELSEGSVDSLGWPKPSNVLCKNANDNQLFHMWSRLVAFAYHIIQLNHGNCYYDYSSQLLTAVLACDALRRGVNRMCDILQYYVSPIKFTSDSEDGSTNCKKSKKKSYVSKKIRKSFKYNCKSSLHKRSFTKRYPEHLHSCSLWQHHRKAVPIQIENKTSPPKEWQRSERTSALRTLWPEDLDDLDLEDSICPSRAVNPMLHLVRYLDDILKTDMDFNKYDY